MTHRLIAHRPIPGAQMVSSAHYVLTWDTPLIMGVLNITPDSFSDGSDYHDQVAALGHARAMLSAGARVIDIGGESTRPGTTPVAAEVEKSRVLPVIERLVQDTDAIISIDSYKPEVVDAALEAGAHIANDISGARNPEMLSVCAQHGAPLIIMHMQGAPLTMQAAPSYQDPSAEIHHYLLAQAKAALAAGVPSVMLDVGIGFGKTLSHNLDLLTNLHKLVAAGHPVLLGASRKRTIEMIEGVSSHPKARDPGTLALHLWGVQEGVAMLRVHNVPAQAQALTVWQALRHYTLDMRVS